MGIDTYRVRAARLAKHLATEHGLSLSTSQSLTALAAEEGIPRADWNVLAARAKAEPIAQPSELIVGQPGCGKTLWIKQEILRSLTAHRPTLVISPTPEYQHIARIVGGSLYRQQDDGQFVTERYGDTPCYVIEIRGSAPSLSNATSVFNMLELSKSEQRVLHLYCDEIHWEIMHCPWLPSVVKAIAEHDDAQIRLAGQFADEGVLTLARTARISTLRIFSLRLTANLWRDTLEQDTHTIACVLRPGESITRSIVIESPNHPRTTRHAFHETRLGHSAELQRVMDIDAQSPWGRLFAEGARRRAETARAETSQPAEPAPRPRLG